MSRKDRGHIIQKRPLQTLHYWILQCYPPLSDILETVTPSKNMKHIKVLNIPEAWWKIESHKFLTLWISQSGWKKKFKTLAEILCSSVEGCISSGNCKKTILCLHVLWILLGKEEGRGDRQTDIKARIESEWAAWLWSSCQLVFKGLQNQPISFQLCEEECLHAPPAVMARKRSTF